MLLTTSIASLSVADSFVIDPALSHGSLWCSIDHDQSIHFLNEKNYTQRPTVCRGVGAFLYLRVVATTQETVIALMCNKTLSL